MLEPTQFSERQQSEFNMAISYLNRINYIIYLCNESALTRDYSKWFHSLLTLYREISTEMKKNKDNNEFNKAMKYIEKIQPMVTKYNNSKELYMELHNFEMFLRKIMRDCGLQMKVKDDPRFAL